MYSLAFRPLSRRLACMAVFMSLPGAAFATQLEEVVVTGQALAQQRAIEFKRNTRAIVDATSQDDIGRLPDLNTAAVIRRLPGVGVQNDQAEARFAIVRGLNATYNNTTIDGVVMASPERGGNARAIPLDVIPASMLSRLEVYKTVTPDMDHNAIGGTINLVTRSAFDEDGPFFYGQIFGGRHEQSGDGGTLDGDDETQPWRTNFSTGMLFGNSQQVGVTASADYSIRNFEIPQVEVDDADYTEFDDDGNNVGLGNGNGIIVPTNQRIFWYNNERERIGGHLKLEWRPSDWLHAELAGSYVEFNDDERRDENIYELGTSGAASQPAMITDQTATSGITETGFGNVGIGRFTIDRQISSLRGKVDYLLTDALTLNLRATVTSAELDNPESTESFSTDTTFGARYDTSSFFNRFSPLDPAGFFDPASYSFNSRGVLDRFAEDDIYEVGGDLSWQLDQLRVPLELKTGFAYRNREKEEGFDFASFIANAPYTLADAADTALSGEVWQGGYTMPFRVDSVEANQAFISNAFDFTAAATSVNRTEAEEEIGALYAMATIEFDALTVIGGVRWEDTTWEGGDAVAGSFVDGDYDNFLFDIQVNWMAMADLMVRAAFTQTLGRPDINALTRGQNLDLDNRSVSRSNPALQPRESNNIDLSLEYYIPEGILAAAVFYKDIENEIFLSTSSVDLTINGQQFTQVTQPENAEDAEIVGLELQYQQKFFFLPEPWSGLGVSANATFLDTEFNVPTANGSRQTGFFQQPDQVYNLAGFYANDYFEVRASWNWTDEFIDVINANDINRDEFWDSREQLDAQLRVNVTDKVSVIAEVANLTDEGRRELSGPGGSFLQEDASFGRTFWVGVSATF